MSEEADSLSTMRLEHLVAQYERELKIDPRVAAETAYALAFCYRDRDVDGERRFDLAKMWAECAIRLLDGLSSRTIQDVAATRQSIGGVPLPEMLHSGVVRNRLGDVLV